MARRRGYGWRWERSSYPVPKPREAKGGIKAQAQRGAFGSSWWAKRWVMVLESFSIGARLSRGKSYARRGQVTDIQVSEGMVKATVQGSRSRPYQVIIRVKSLAEGDWSKVVTGLGAQALYAAKLLAGEMPNEVEEVFTAVGLSLFPSRVADLETSCSCPDWSNPCKHIAAVFYLLGEEFDRDPFLIFRLRGLGRDELMSRLSETAPTSGETPARKRRRSVPVSGASGQVNPPEPLPVDVGAFWGARGTSVGTIGNVRAAEAVAALPRRLGGFPFWRSSPPLLETLDHLYRAASSTAFDLLAGSAPDPTEPGSDE